MKRSFDNLSVPGNPPMTTTVARTPRLHSGLQRRLAAVWSRATKNPRWLIMDAFSRFVLIRRAVKLIQEEAKQYDVAASRFMNVDTRAFVASLNRDGFCTGLALPRDAMEKILRFARAAICYGDADPRCGFKYADRAVAQTACKRVFSQATYLFLDDLQQTVDDLATDPLLLSIAANYIRSPPVITGSRLWWVFATPESDYDNSITTSFFHYDKDDYAAVRLFFYLTPVDDGHGPHVVVRGSHLHKNISQIASFGERSDRQIERAYGSDKLTTIYGSPGSGFAEDPFCFHKATRPTDGDRLMLEVKYAARDYKIFPAADRSRAANILDTAATRATQ